MTKTLPLAPAHTNPTPKAFFLSSAENIETHHKLIESEPFQRAIQVGLAHYTRALLAAAPQKLESENYLQASALVYARLQGANDIICLICDLAEFHEPKPPGQRQTDNLE